MRISLIIHTGQRQHALSSCHTRTEPTASAHHLSVETKNIYLVARHSQRQRESRLRTQTPTHRSRALTFFPRAKMSALAQARAPVSLLRRRRNPTVRASNAPRLAVRAIAGKQPPSAEEEKEEEAEAKIDWSGLRQLVKMGLGTISGDITEINLNDPKRTVVMELEANNFEDADGNPLNFMNNEVGCVSKWCVCACACVHPVPFPVQRREERGGFHSC